MRTRRLPNAASLRAAWWAWQALHSARALLRSGRLSDVRLPGPPPLPASAIAGVEAVLRRRPHTCLEAALLRQRWLVAHGVQREIVIGVTSPAAGFAAHAWLDGEMDARAARFQELTRLAP